MRDSCCTLTSPVDRLLLMAVRENLPRVVHALLQEGANPYIKGHDGYSVLMLACWAGHYLNVRVLVEEGRADVNASIEVERDYGGTALAIAAQLGYFDIVHYLLRNGANPKTVDKDRDTPVLLAERGGYHEIAALLRSYPIKP